MVVPANGPESSELSVLVRRFIEGLLLELIPDVLFALGGGSVGSCRSERAFPFRFRFSALVTAVLMGLGALAPR